MDQFKLKSRKDEGKDAHVRTEPRDGTGDGGSYSSDTEEQRELRRKESAQKQSEYFGEKLCLHTPLLGT